MDAALSRNTPTYYVKLAVMAAIMMLFRHLPQPPGLSAEGLAVVGVFFGVLYGWLFIDMVWPSLAGILALGLVLPEPMDLVLRDTFGNSTFLLLLFFCMVASVINSAGVAGYLARRIVGASFVDGRPWLLVFMLCLAMCALACMLTMTAAVLVAFPLVREVCRQYGYRPGDVFPMVLLLAMLFVANIAYLLLPFKSMPAIVFGVYGQMSGGEQIALAPYMVVMTALLLLSIVFVLGYLRFVVRPDVERMRAARGNLRVEDKLSSYQRAILWSFVGLIVLLLLLGMLPGDWCLARLLKGLGYNGILLAYVCFYLLLNFREGIGLGDIMHRSVAWPALFLVAAVLRITGAFVATGVTDFIASACGPMLQGVSSTLLVFIVVFVATGCTQLANNNASAAIFAPVAYTLAVANGSVEPQALLCCVLLSCSNGMLTPASSTTSAILYGDMEWVRQKTLLPHAVCFWIFNVVLAAFVGYPLITLLF